MHFSTCILLYLSGSLANQMFSIPPAPYQLAMTALVLKIPQAWYCLLQYVNLL